MPFLNLANWIKLIRLFLGVKMLNANCYLLMHKSIHIFIDPLIERFKGFVQRNPVFSIAVVAQT